MAKLTLILGGARSGKSAFAVELGKKYERVTYIATARIIDDEMRERVKMHQRLRPPSWKTLEVPFHADKVFSDLKGQTDLVLLDCITLYIANILFDEKSPEKKEDYILEEVDKLCEAAKKWTADVILVSNEVGMGIVPENALARQFRDIAGLVNQRIAQKADSVFLISAGLPIKVK